MRPLHGMQRRRRGGAKARSAASEIMSAWLGEAMRGQVEQVRHFWRTPALRIPILNIWVATFGGALHAPCTTFFLLELGLTPAEIGNGGMLMAAPDLVMAPIYGYLLDRFGAFPVILSTASCCAFGCLIRGFAISVTHVYIGSAIIGLGAANLWVSVLTHISQHTPSDKREACVSAFVFQVSVLRIAGKSAYFPCVWLLEQAGVQSLLTRYRIMMVTCPFFCIFGWASLMLCGRATRESRPEAEAPPGAAAGSDGAGARGKRGPARELLSLGFVVIAAGVLIDAAARFSASVAWPLIAKDRYGWGASEFAAPLFAESLASAGLVFFAPTLSRRAGGGARTSVALALLCAALAAAAAAVFGNGLLVGLLAILSAKDPCLRALGSLTLPAHVQGRAFAAMSATRSLGETLGNWAGTRLYDPAAPLAVPLALAAALLAAEAAALAAAFSLRRDGGKARPSPPVTPQPPQSPTATELAARPPRDGALAASLEEKLALLPTGV